MSKKKVVLVGSVLIGSGLYFIARPKRLRATSIKLRKAAVYLKMAAVCIQIVGEHPELQEDPRLKALEEEYSFFDIVDRL